MSDNNDDMPIVSNTSNTPTPSLLDTDTIPILPVRELVAFPQMTLPFMVSLESAQLIEDAVNADGHIGLVTVKDEDAEDPVPGELFEVGTLAKIMHAKKNSDGIWVVLLNALHRFRISAWEAGGPYLRAHVTQAPEIVESDLETEALQRQLLVTFQAVLAMTPDAPDEMGKTIAQIEDPLQLAYVTAFNMKLSTKRRQALLELDSVNAKLRELLARLAREKEMLSIGQKIQTEVREKMTKSQREYVLRQQLDAIKKELGENEEESTESDDYARRLEEADLPKEARKEAQRELERMQNMSPQSAEYPMIKNYLDWLIDLPWNKTSEDNTDITAARDILEADHFGLDEVKERLIEYLAVRRLMQTREEASSSEDDNQAPGVILCLAGPPGVGKTSLGRSVARALGRSFTRMSLGGVRDEAEIRGHRRTYIGALPGRIIQAIKRAGTRNPVFMLDEIDKVGQDWRGDPSSALLEVLDPAQNGAFRDHYLDVDFDLSEVIFIATANQLDTIPGPLRDRMEIITLDGYTELEKLQIAKRHLIPRQLAAHRLRDDEVTFIDDAIQKIIQDYTREAGVRNLERHIAAVCRKGIVQLSEKGWPHVVITSKMVRAYLKKERFESEYAEHIAVPGIATGLAVTAVGGDILYIEASRMPGTGRLNLTGQLGDVMRESAEIAHSYVRSQAEALQIDPTLFEKSDVHLHVPAGALPKDGPSAGVAMTMALTSLFSDRPVRSEVGITGEVTLRGRVLPVGGIKMKVLAAHRAGLKTVVLPARNRPDLDELPDEVRRGMEFVTVDHVDDAVAVAFASPPAPADDAGGKNEKPAAEGCNRNAHLVPLACRDCHHDPSLAG
ncbi:MAG: endopeptidase La [Desulfobacterales bacterium]|nr:endopeptidase La [Desulfobacterales bacterium]